MPRAGYEVIWVDGVPVVATPDEIDVTNAAEFRQCLLSCTGGRHVTLVVDMSETTFCDSTGLYQLVRARKRALAAGGELRLVIRTAPVLRLFAIMGIDRLFPVYPSLDEAVAARPGPASAGTIRPATLPANASGPPIAPAMGNGLAPRPARGTGPNAAPAPAQPASSGQVTKHD